MVDTTSPRSTTTADEHADPSRIESRNGSGFDDGSMIRSEERLTAGTIREPTGVAVLRKTVVTEPKTITVEVRHEEAHLEHRPLAGEPAGASVSATGPMPSVILYEERLVVTKQLVPVERVSLRMDTVTEQQQVTDVVRREQIEITGDVPHS